jgi:hypothetical protein
LASLDDAATVDSVKRALSRLYASRLLLAAVIGTFATVIGAAALAAIIVAQFLGLWAGIAAAATVGGAATTRAALAWSGLSVVEEASK